MCVDGVYRVYNNFASEVKWRPIHALLQFVRNSIPGSFRKPAHMRWRQHVTCRLGNGPSGFSDVPHATLTTSPPLTILDARVHCIYAYNIFIYILQDSRAYEIVCMRACACVLVRVSLFASQVLLYTICTRGRRIDRRATMERAYIYIYALPPRVAK